ADTPPPAAACGRVGRAGRDDVGGGGGGGRRAGRGAGAAPGAPRGAVGRDAGGAAGAARAAARRGRPPAAVLGPRATGCPRRGAGPPRPRRARPAPPRRAAAGGGYVMRAVRSVTEDAPAPSRITEPAAAPCCFFRTCGGSTGVGHTDRLVRCGNCSYLRPSRLARRPPGGHPAASPAAGAFSPQNRLRMAQRPEANPDPVNPSRRGREVAEVTADVPPSDVLPSREGERFGDGAGPKAGVAVAEGKQWFGHPRGLSTLFMTEMWERFSYYGGRALLILYMTDAVATGGLGLTVAEAGALYGLYTAVVYMTNLPGGWLADKFL